MSKFFEMAIPSKFIQILDIDTHDLLWTPLSLNIIFVMVQCILGEKVAFQQKTLTFFKFFITLISVNTSTEHM